VKVHLVVFEYKTSWILARLACHLAKYNGWGIGTRPDPRAHVNIFFPYLKWRFSKWTEGKTAAFFTHYDTNDKYKCKHWNHLAANTNLRVTMAEQYARKLQKHGLTINVTPPVESDRFRLKGKAKHERPVIGVSGDVYRGGRKGEHLVRQLAKDHSKEWKFVGSGMVAFHKDWPIRTKRYRWKDMPDYYRMLNVFLCTSLIEGGPVTVLEALACGRPIVVPHGVGLINELPDDDGIYRYEAGNYGQMVTALELAVKDKTPLEQLRGYVVDRTPERYAREWKEAVGQIA